MSARRLTARALLAAARTPLGGRVAALACARAGRLLPVECLAQNARAIAFRHPSPEAPDHVVIVSRAYLPSFCALVGRGRSDVLLEIVALARVAASSLGRGPRALTINAGRRQEVGQLHAHLLPEDSAGFLLSRVAWRRSVDLGSSVDLDDALAAAARALDGCSRRRWSSLVLRGFLDGDRVELAVNLSPASIAPAPRLR
jgi:diadenosine tetraphosphate (Ap4A) HIT family hydrolase